MSKFKSLAANGIALAVAGLVALPAAAAVSLDFQVAFNPTNDTHVILRATTDHYKPLPGDLQRAAVICHRPEEMAVVFFLAREGRVPVRDIVARRTQGSTWGELFREYHVPNERLYLDVPAQVGPPYGKAKGHAKRKGKDTKQLTDQEIVELVGLQLAADYYHVEPTQVIDSRRNGISYVSIHGGLYREQHPVRMQRVKAAPDDDGDEAIVIGRGGSGKLKGKGKNDGSN